VPWHNRTKIKRDIKAAEKVLNADHFGLEKVKSASSNISPSNSASRR